MSLATPLDDKYLLRIKLNKFILQRLTKIPSYGYSKNYVLKRSLQTKDEMKKFNEYLKFTIGFIVFIVKRNTM